MPFRGGLIQACNLTQFCHALGGQEDVQSAFRARIVGEGWKINRKASQKPRFYEAYRSCSFTRLKHLFDG